MEMQRDSTGGQMPGSEKDGDSPADTGNNHSQNNSSSADGRDPDTTQGRADSPEAAGGLSRPEIGDSFRSRDPSRSFGFPEFRDLETGGSSSRDADLRNSKNLYEGLWELTTGADATAGGLFSFVTKVPSMKQIGVGLAVGAGVFLLGPELLFGGAVAGAAESVLGAEALYGVESFVNKIAVSGVVGGLASEAVGLYEEVKTRSEGLVKFSGAARELGASRHSADHIPGESRSKGGDIKP